MSPRDADHGAPPATDAPSPAVPPRTCAFRLPAELAAAWAARARIRAWLTAHRFADDLVDDLEYLVSEAVSNSAEHAYAGQAAGAVEVDAEVVAAGRGCGRCGVAVRDRGRWRPVDPDPGHRGHGIAAMAALAQEVTIRRRPAPGGTELVLVSPPAVDPAVVAPPVRARPSATRREHQRSREPGRRRIVVAMVPPTAYRIRFTADPVQLILFRGGLDRWLFELDWPEAERVDVLLAVSEACCNAVRHAYAGTEAGDVEVTGRLVLGPADRRLRWTVRDHGRWRADPDGTGFGLPTVRACMDRVAVRGDDRGTVVTMTSRPVPLVGPLPVRVPVVGGADDRTAGGRPVLRAVPGGA